MPATASDAKLRAVELINRMSTGQISAVVGLLETMLDPVSVALANAPFEDEQVDHEEASDIADSRAEYAHGEFVSNEKILAEMGLTEGDFERMQHASVEFRR